MYDIDNVKPPAGWAELWLIEVRAAVILGAKQRVHTTLYEIKVALPLPCQPAALPPNITKRHNHLIGAHAGANDVTIVVTQSTMFVPKT